MSELIDLLKAHAAELLRSDQLVSIVNAKLNIPGAPEALEEELIRRVLSAAADAVSGGDA